MFSLTTSLALGGRAFGFDKKSFFFPFFVWLDFLRRTSTTPVPAKKKSEKQEDFEIHQVKCVE
jgi:hypothetical protein